MLAVVTLPHGQITTLSDEATLSRGLSHHRITLVARLGRALVAEHQAESSFRVQQLLMWLRVAAHAPTTMPHPTPQEGIGISYGSRLPTSTCLGILPEVSRVHTVGLKRDDVGGVLLDAPSALCGSRDCLQGRTRLTCTVPITLTPCAMSNPTASIYD